MSSFSVTSLQSLTCPKQVKTNQNSGLIKLLACIFMFIDHAGKMLFPQYPVMRMIGRLAFPMFAYGIAVGAVYTRDPIRYLTRVVLLLLISQPLYALGLAHENPAMFSVPFTQNPLLSAYTFYVNSWQTPSILLSLSLALTLILCLRQQKFILAIGVYMVCVRFSSSLDYGIHGIHLMLLFYLLCEHPILSLIGTTSFMLWWSLQGSGYPIFGIQFSMRIYALPAVLFVNLPLRKQIKLPKWLTYGFYPAHLALLAILVRVL